MLLDDREKENRGFVLVVEFSFGSFGFLLLESAFS